MRIAFATSHAAPRQAGLFHPFHALNRAWNSGFKLAGGLENKHSRKNQQAEKKEAPKLSKPWFWGGQKNDELPARNGVGSFQSCDVSRSGELKANLM